MRVVVDLDAARHACEPEGLRQPLEKPRLRGCLRQPASERFARVLGRVVGEVLLFAPLRHAHRHPVPGLGAQRLRQQRLFLDRMRQEHRAWHRLVVVELRQERAQHLRRLERGIGLREIGAVAPVLAGAEEEHLDAVLPALLVDREDVRLLQRLWIDALVALHVAERGKPVAIDRRAFEVERFRRLLHGASDLRLHRDGAAGEKVLRLVHQRVVVVRRDLARARARAALDLVEQARPRPALEHRIRAGSQQEGALQCVDGPSHRAGRGEGTEIVALARARAAMLEDAGRGVVARQQDIGKRLVVPHQHVEARAQAFDEVRLEQQRLGLCTRDDEFHRRRLADHPPDALCVAAPLGVVRHPLLQAARLADIEHVRRSIHHPVDAGRVRQALHQRLDQLDAAFPFGVAARSRPVDLGADVGDGLALNDIVVVILGAGHVAGDILVLAAAAHSAIPSTSGVRQARCCPPSSVIICPVIELFCHR